MDRTKLLAALLLAAGAAPALAQDNSTYQGGNLPGYNEPSRDQKVPSSSDAEDHREKVKTQRHRKAHRSDDKNGTPSRVEPAQPGTGDIPEKSVKPGTTGTDDRELDENRSPAPNPPKSDTEEQTDQGNYK